MSSGLLLAEEDEPVSSSSSDDEKRKEPSSLSKLSQQERKALDREIPWREILRQDPDMIKAFVQSNIKEFESWTAWGTTVPVPEEEADKILKDPILRRRVIPARNAYRQKSTSTTAESKVPHRRAWVLGPGLEQSGKVLTYTFTGGRSSPAADRGLRLQQEGAAAEQVLAAMGRRCVHSVPPGRS